MNNALLSLALAIASYEGWDAAKGGGPDGLSPTVAYRNHNPGNLRSSPFAEGKRDGFAFFHSDFVGFFAMVWDIRAKCVGNTSTGLGPSSTLADLIAVWAPASENDVEAYTAYIEKRTGLSRSVQLRTLAS